MKYFKDWWLVGVAALTLAAQWGIVTQKVYAFDKAQSDVSDVKERLSHIEEILISNSHDTARIESELVQIRQILLRQAK
jgi:hypothetical protein